MIEASGVLSSWDALATKSCRIRSSRRSSVTSWKTKTAPGDGWPGRGLPRTERNRLLPRCDGSRAGEGELSFVSGGSSQAKGRLDGILDLGAADQLRDQPADRGRVEPKEPIGAGVGKEQAAAEIDGDDGLGHGPQHDEKLLPVLIEPRGPGLDFVRGRVERPHQPADRPLRHGQDRAHFLPSASASRPRATSATANRKRQTM